MFEKLIRFLACRVVRVVNGHDDESCALRQTLALSLASTPVLFGGDWARVRLGKNVRVVNALFNLSSGNITVGDNSFFGHNVCLLTGTHDLAVNGVGRQGFPTEGRDIDIGKGVWIASNVTVIGPCRIEDDVVVAAGAVVVRGVLEAGGVYAGVPAKRVR